MRLSTTTKGNGVVERSSNPVQIRLSGTFGHRPSTIAGQFSAKQHFDNFVSYKNIVGKTSMDNLAEAELCSITIWQEFGTYLSEIALNTKTGDLLKWGTAKQFFSGAKTVAKKRFPENNFWLKQDDWYRPIIKDIEQTISVRCMELGVAVEDKSVGVGRAVLKNVFSCMLKETTAKQKAAVTNWAASLTVSLAIGRSGEVGLTHWDLAH